MTVKKIYPIPRIEDILNKMKGKRYFSLLDCPNGFWLMKMRDTDKHLTAFMSQGKIYQFKGMPIGLINAPVEF